MEFTEIWRVVAPDSYLEGTNYGLDYRTHLFDSLDAAEAAYPDEDQQKVVCINKDTTKDLVKFVEKCAEGGGFLGQAAKDLLSNLDNQDSELRKSLSEFR